MRHVNQPHLPPVVHYAFITRSIRRVDFDRCRRSSARVAAPVAARVVAQAACGSGDVLAPMRIIYAHVWLKLTQNDCVYVYVCVCRGRKGGSHNVRKISSLKCVRAHGSRSGAAKAGVRVGDDTLPCRVYVCKTCASSSTRTHTHAGTSKQARSHQRTSKRISKQTPFAPAHMQARTHAQPHISASSSSLST